MSFPVKFGAKTETKSIIIDGSVHKKYRDYCRGKSLKIGSLTEDLIKLYLSDPKTFQKLIDELDNKQEDIK
jgi:hypothetical protein